MPTFNLFRFQIKPAFPNELYAKISSGDVIVFVIDDNPHNALQRAINHVEKAKWEIISKEIFPTSNEESQCEDPYLIKMQEKAKATGVGCIYHYGIGDGPIFN